LVDWLIGGLNSWILPEAWRMYMKYVSQLLENQLDAALQTLHYCIECCPVSAWDEAQGDFPFSQVVFHTLFYTDYYLGRDSQPFKNQKFHVQHAAVFSDYEELENKQPQHLYTRDFCLAYLEHCRGKVRSVMSGETETSLAGPSGIDFRHCNRAELHVYNVRHIQHHAAQLGFRIQLLTTQYMPWFTGGA
jgi:hypothetical protein